MSHTVYIVKGSYRVCRVGNWRQKGGSGCVTEKAVEYFLEFDNMMGEV